VDGNPSWASFGDRFRGLTSNDYEEVDRFPRGRSVGVIAAGSFSVRAAVLHRAAAMAAKHLERAARRDWAQLRHVNEQPALMTAAALSATSRRGAWSVTSRRLSLVARSSQGPVPLDKSHGPGVNGHLNIPGGGQEISPVVAMDFPMDGHEISHRCHVARGVTPLPVVAWARRNDSPLVTQMWAWCSSRSTVAVANVFGMISSNPAGCRLDDTASERVS
jgi:hypothetical protein